MIGQGAYKPRTCTPPGASVRAPVIQQIKCDLHIYGEHAFEFSEVLAPRGGHVHPLSAPPGRDQRVGGLDRPPVTLNANRKELA